MDSKTWRYFANFNLLFRAHAAYVIVLTSREVWKVLNNLHKCVPTSPKPSSGKHNSSVFAAQGELRTSYASGNQTAFPNALRRRNTSASQPAFENLAWPLTNMFPFWFWFLGFEYSYPTTPLALHSVENPFHGRIGQEILMEFSSHLFFLLKHC